MESQTGARVKNGCGRRGEGEGGGGEENGGRRVRGFGEAPGGRGKRSG